MKLAFRDWCIAQWEEFHRRQVEMGYYETDGSEDEEGWQMQGEDEEVGW